MTDKLKEFVNKNKEEFSTEEPSKDLWNKIDSRLRVNNSSSISSKLVSKLKYFGLSATLLVIAVYFITQKLDNSSSNELAQNAKDSAMNNSGEWVKANQNKEIIQAGEAIPPSRNEKNAENNEGSDAEKERLVKLTDPKVTDGLNDSIDKNVSEVGTDHIAVKETDKPVANSAADKKEVSSVKKKGKVIVPTEPEKVNSYSGTLYSDYSFCSVLRAYKFPGQVSMDESGNFQGHRIMETMSCTKLDRVPNMKAVWLKGRTNKKLTISVKEGFKNIVLIKSDGREIHPDAISHYYPGLGVISDYTGKFFEITYKEKVELILFFKDVAEGDKILIDKKIELVVAKP